MSTDVVHRGGPVLTTKKAAEYCGIAVQTLYNLLSEGEGPTKRKQGRLNVFYPSDLDNWLAGRITEGSAPTTAGGER